MNLGHPAHPWPNGTRDHRTPEKRGTEEVSQPVAPPGPRGQAKAGLPEAPS
jgi:hypothetical protein